MTQPICKSCQTVLSFDDKFCPSCGSPFRVKNDETQKDKKVKTDTISSSGNYSGTMVKGKKTRAFKIFRNAIVSLVLAVVLAVVIWFQVDPDAGKKLKDVFFGTVFMIFFFFVGWLHPSTKIFP